MVNDLPTIFEVVSGNEKKPSKDKSSVSNNSSNRSKSNSKRGSESRAKYLKAEPEDEEEDEEVAEEEEEEDDEEQGETNCGACGESYATDEFWICCDLCENWFHGKCVKITPARAEHIKHYKCPNCSKRART